MLYMLLIKLFIQVGLSFIFSVSNFHLQSNFS